MDIDDPRFVQAHKDMAARIERYDERIVTVLKSHLGVEQSLDDLLKTASRRWRGRTFAGKIDVAQKLFLPEFDEHIWSVLKAGNNLRNAVAHGDKEGTISARMTDLRKAYVAAVSPGHRKGVEGMTDTQIVGSVFNHCGSHLVVAADRLAEKNKKKK
jgi:hypothetical protein